MFRDLESHKDVDPEVGALWAETGGDPEAVRRKMEEYCAQADAKSGGGMVQTRLGRDENMRVVFREYDPSATYVRFLRSRSLHLLVKHLLLLVYC
jgi:hypothetical protein